jgi:hypothetical protein
MDQTTGQTIRLPNNWNPAAYQLPSWLAWEAGRWEIQILRRRAGKDALADHR